MQIVPYKAEHLLALEPAEEHLRYSEYITPAVAKSLEGFFARSMLDGATVIGCAGLAQRWHENWVAWSYLSKHAGPHMRRITRAVKGFMPIAPRGRIEAATPIEFEAGRRWLELLGFKNETPDGMAHYTPGGHVYTLYSLVNLP